MDFIRPPVLKRGDRVRLLSPASTPEVIAVENSARYLRSLGLEVELGKHVLDRFGFLAGQDVDRLSDVNEALRDPGVKAIFATRGGKGAYRIASGLDFEAAMCNPKLLVGFSEVTILHLVLQKHCGLAGVHGAPWEKEQFGIKSAESFKKAIFSTEVIEVESNPKEITSELTTTGSSSGFLIGGNQDMIGTAASWALPSLDRAILLLEAVDMRMGHIDRQLTMLIEGGHLSGLVGVAVGQYSKCDTLEDMSTMDLLREKLDRLNVPILGGLPIGHGENPIAIPVGTMATINADKGTLVIESAVSN